MKAPVLNAFIACRRRPDREGCHLNVPCALGRGTITPRSLTKGGGFALKWSCVIYSNLKVLIIDVEEFQMRKNSIILIRFLSKGPGMIIVLGALGLENGGATLETQRPHKICGGASRIFGIICFLDRTAGKLEIRRSGGGAGRQQTNLLLRGLL